MNTYDSLQSRRRGVLQHSAAAFLAAFALAGAASAQTSITGTIYDGVGGPLLSGVVYHVTGNITVPVGETLTVQSGAIVKFATGRCIVNGTLDVNGTSGSGVTFTSLFDDLAGGDTNANGPSSGAAGDWEGIALNGAGTITMDYTDIAFAGAGGWSAMYSQNGSLTMSNSTLRDSLTSGMDLNNYSSVPSVTNCDFRDNAAYAVEDAAIGALAGFMNSTASGNAQGDFVRVTSPNPSVDLTIGTENTLNDLIVLTTNSTVPVGVTLTFGAGVIVKWEVGRMIVHGTVRALGTALDPVVLTALEDDDHGGDSNENGASSGTPGAWSGIEVNPSGAIELDRTIIRFAGSGGFAPVYGKDGSIELTDCVVSDALGSGIDLNHYNAVPTIRNCDLRDNGGYAATDLHIDSVRGFFNTTASGNTLGDHMRVTVPNPTQNMTIQAENTIDGVLVYTTNGTVPTGVTLTIKSGVTVKWVLGRQIVNGTLRLLGTLTNGIAFTSIDDDSMGGDTSNDGASVGTPGDWSGIEVNASGTLDARYATLRFAGSGGYAPVYCDDGEVIVRHCVMSDALGAGMDFNGFQAVPIVEFCDFVDNGGVAVTDLSLGAVQGFADNTASGNAGGDYMRVTSPTAVDDVTICKQNCLEGALVFTVPATIPTGVTVTFEEGVHVKWAGAYGVTVAGTLNLLGTAFDPIVITSLHDDAIDGDTNQNGGATTPAAGDWQVINYSASATTSRVENVLLRYPGSFGWDGIVCSSSAVTLRSIRVEHAAYDGFQLSACAGNPVNLVAFDCAQAGFRLLGGSFDLVHATSVGNDIGVIATAPFTGDIVNSIAWGNTSSNFSGLAPARLDSCDGDAAAAGSNGNINTDPLFVDASVSVGDLRLLSASPCIDVADATAASAVRKDHTENSRMLDPTLSGVLEADMGAYENDNWRMSLVGGEPRIGGALKFRVDGEPGTSLYTLGFLDGTTLDAPYGFITVGTTMNTTVGLVAVGTVLRIPIPRDTALVGLGFGVQTKTLPTSPSGVGAITNLYRSKLGSEARPRPRKIRFGNVLSGTVGLLE